MCSLEHRVLTLIIFYFYALFVLPVAGSGHPRDRAPRTCGPPPRTTEPLCAPPRENMGTQGSTAKFPGTSPTRPSHVQAGCPPSSTEQHVSAASGLIISEYSISRTRSCCCCCCCCQSYIVQLVGGLRAWGTYERGETGEQQKTKKKNQNKIYMSGGPRVVLLCFYRMRIS